jgi:hypothetical protein
MKKKITGGKRTTNRVLKDLLLSSECLTDTQENQIERLKYSDSELEDMVLGLFTRYDKALQLARKLHEDAKKKLKDFDAPPLWGFGVPTVAPPDFKSQYLQELASRRCR